MDAMNSAAAEANALKFIEELPDKTPFFRTNEIFVENLTPKLFF